MHPVLGQIKYHWRTFLFGLCVGLIAVPLILLLNQHPTNTPIALLPPLPTPTQISLRIHLIGAVKNPGIYQLPPNAIVQDAIDAAGGLTAQADSSQLNLAGLLNDGQQLAIPNRPPTLLPTSTVGPGTPTPEPPTPTPSALTKSQSANSQQPAGPTQVINLNTATQVELESLPRIGPGIAQRIIDYRTLHGPFTSPEQIKNVKGIGEATFNAIKDFITVK